MITVYRGVKESHVVLRVGLHLNSEPRDIQVETSAIEVKKVF